MTAKEALKDAQTGQEAAAMQALTREQHFEQEKNEFLSAIQENMQILDAMLKQYAVKNSQGPPNNMGGGGSVGSNSTIG